MIYIKRNKRLQLSISVRLSPYILFAGCQSKRLPLVFSIVDNLEGAKAVVEAAEELSSPIMIQVQLRSKFISELFCLILVVTGAPSGSRVWWTPIPSNAFNV